MEKQLIQARLKSINSLLDNNAKQIELTRSQIASFIPTPSYNKCQEFNNSQAGSSQAGNTPLADSAISQLDSEVSQLGSS